MSAPPPLAYTPAQAALVDEREVVITDYLQANFVNTRPAGDPLSTLKAVQKITAYRSAKVKADLIKKATEEDVSELNTRLFSSLPFCFYLLTLLHSTPPFSPSAKANLLRNRDRSTASVRLCNS